MWCKGKIAGKIQPHQPHLRTCSVTHLLVSGLCQVWKQRWGRYHECCGSDAGVDDVQLLQVNSSWKYGLSWNIDSFPPIFSIEEERIPSLKSLLEPQCPTIFQNPSDPAFLMQFEGEKIVSNSTMDLEIRPLKSAERCRRWSTRQKGPRDGYPSYPTVPVNQIVKFFVTAVLYGYSGYSCVSFIDIYLLCIYLLYMSTTRYPSTSSEWGPAIWISAWVTHGSQKAKAFGNPIQR